MLTIYEIDNLIPENYESETKEYRDVCLSGLDKSEETVIVGPEGAGIDVVYKMLSDYYGDKALCLAGSVSMETAMDEATTLYAMVDNDYDAYAIETFERQLKGKEIVMVYAVEKMPLEAIRFVITAIDNVSIKFGKQIKMAFFLGSESSKSAMALEYIKAFACRPVHVFDLLQCKQAGEIKAEAC